MTKQLLALAALGALVFGGCTSNDEQPQAAPAEPTPADTDEPASDDFHDDDDPCMTPEGASELTDKEFQELCLGVDPDAPVEGEHEVGETWTFGPWEVTVTGFELGLDEVGGGDGWEPTYPEHDQLAALYLEVTNRGSAPESFVLADVELLDADGRTFTGLWLLGDSEIAFDQQPDTTAAGYVTFDLPDSVTGGDAVIFSDLETGEVVTVDL